MRNQEGTSTSTSYLEEIVFFEFLEDAALDRAKQQNGYRLSLKVCTGCGSTDLPLISTNWFETSNVKREWS